jgi:hypothetical protein
VNLLLELFQTLPAGEPPAGGSPAGRVWNNSSRRFTASSCW